jgi:hypothetical protein
MSLNKFNRFLYLMDENCVDTNTEQPAEVKKSPYTENGPPIRIRNKDGTIPYYTFDKGGKRIKETWSGSVDYSILDIVNMNPMGYATDDIIIFEDNSQNF